jgi:cobalt-zinc-cadmium resistance protein CzcA
MISRILALSIQYRWVVVLLSVGAVALGLWSLVRLPIDAVPDITNKQIKSTPRLSHCRRSKSKNR